MDKSIYEPREDSFLLEKWVKKLACGKVLAMGSGSGILAKAALKNTSNVLTADINPRAITHLKSLGINTRQSDLFKNITGRFDIIIFNPPYLPADKREPKESALTTTGGEQGHEIIKRFLKTAKKHLKKDGKILLLFSSLSGNTLDLIKKYHYEAKLLDKKKLFFEQLYVYELAA